MVLILLTGAVEDSYKQNPNSYKTIYPALKIDKKIYQLKEDKNYTTTDGVGYMVWGYKDSDGNPAVNGLTDKLKLFMKANGTEESSGVYKMVINFYGRLKK